VVPPLLRPLVGIERPVPGVPSPRCLGLRNGSTAAARAVCPRTPLRSRVSVSTSRYLKRALVSHTLAASTATHSSPWTSRRTVTAFVVMALVVGITVASKTAKHSPLLLRTLRATAKLSSTSLFLPWSSLLLQSLGCDGGIWWGGAGVSCYG